MLYLNTDSHEIDTNYLGERVRWDVSRAVAGTVQLVVVDGAIGSTVVTFYRSNDGVNFVAFDTAVTLSAAGFTAQLDVDACLVVEARVTTAAGASNIVRLAGCFKGYP